MCAPTKPRKAAFPTSCQTSSPPHAATLTDWLLRQGTHSAAGWADAIILCPWRLYLAYGDAQILQENYDAMRAWIAFMRAHATNNIWNYRLQFGDWVALDAAQGSYFGATPNDLACTAYYAHSVSILAKVAGILGKSDDADNYTALHRAIADTFEHTFFTQTGEMTAKTQTAHILALQFGLVPPRWRKNRSILAPAFARKRRPFEHRFYGNAFSSPLPCQGRPSRSCL